MPLVASDCFNSLTTSEKWEQFYLAIGGTSECFVEATVFEQQRLFLAALGSEECIYTTEDFWRAWAAFLGIECVESVQEAQRQIYAYYYDEAGDDSLADPACFEGLGPDGQMLALFDGILAGATPTEAPVNLTPPVISGTPEPDEVLTVSTGTWSGGGITYSYQWKLNGANVGANQDTYTVPSDAEDGDLIYCVVTATNIIGAASEDSNAVEVEGAAFDPTTVMDFVFEGSYGVAKEGPDLGAYVITDVTDSTVTTTATTALLNPGDWVIIQEKACEVDSTSAGVINLVNDFPAVWNPLGDTSFTNWTPCEEGDACEVWVARGVSGYYAVQADFSKRPLWYATGAGGELYAVLAFDGSNDFMTFSFGSLTDFTIFGVASAAGDGFLIGRSGANNQVRMRYTGLNKIALNANDESVSDTVPTSLGVLSRIAYRRSGTAATFYQNEVQYGGGALNGPLVLDQIGILNGTILPLNGEVAHLSVEASALSVEDMSLMWAYTEEPTP